MRIERVGGVRQIRLLRRESRAEVAGRATRGLRVLDGASAWSCVLLYNRVMPDWIFQVLSVATALAALALLYWAIFRDRSHGRRRCPKCWYDLRGSDSLTCPECAYTATRERQFFRTRRRWRWVAVVVLISCVSATLWLTPRARRDGWLTLMPTTVVIASLQWTGEDGVKVLSERWAEPDQPVFPRPGVWSWQKQFAKWQARRLLAARYETDLRTSMISLLCGWFDPPEDIGSIIRVWLDEEDPEIRHSAAYLAGLEFSSLDSADAGSICLRLCELLEYVDPEIQGTAAWSLYRYVRTQPAALEAFLKGMSSDSVSIRMQSAFAMSRLETPDPRVVDRLCELIEDKDRAGVAAARALGAIGDASVAPTLIAGIDGSSRDWNEACALALLEIGEEVRSAENTAALAALLDSANADVRVAAVAALMGQGAHAVPHVGRMKDLLDPETASHLASVLNAFQRTPQLTSEVAAPVLLAIAASAMDNPEWRNESAYEVLVAVRLLGGLPDHAEDSIPLLIRLLDVPSFDVKATTVAALERFGPAAAAALPALRARMDETTNPAEDEMLARAIAAIEGASMDQ